MIKQNMTQAGPAPMRVAPIGGPIGGSMEALHIQTAPSAPEVSQTRQNMAAEKLFKQPVDANSKEEGMAITLGRKHREANKGVSPEKRLHTPPSWEDSMESYAALSQIKSGDTFQKGQEPLVEHKGHVYRISEVDSGVDSKGQLVTRLRIGAGPNDCLILEDLIQETKQEGLAHIAKLSPEQQAAPEVQLSQAVLRGESVDSALVKEVAQNLGFITPDSILEIAKGRVGPDGKPLLTESDLKILSGQKIEPPATPKADGTAAAEPAIEIPQPELSETAKKIQEIIKSDQVLDVDQVKGALFALGIPTDSSQVRDILRDSQVELSIKQDELDKFTHNGETDKLAWLKAQQERIQQLKDTVDSYTKLNETLKEETGSTAFDSVTAYYDIIQNGGGDAQFLESFTTAIKNPTIDNIAKFDESYATRVGENTNKKNTANRKAFLKKFIMGAGLGMGGLMAFQVWRASKKDEGQ